MGQAAPQDDSSIIVSLSEAAMHMYGAAIDALPFAEDKKFHKRADVVLEGIRKLRAALADAASSNRPSPAVVVEVSNVRRRYDSLMEHAAAAPVRVWASSCTSRASTPGCPPRRSPTGRGSALTFRMSSRRAQHRTTTKQQRSGLPSRPLVACRAPNTSSTRNPSTPNMKQTSTSITTTTSLTSTATTNRSSRRMPDRGLGTHRADASCRAHR